ncbi:hypothetical protein KKH03_03600, partial [Patescibacteria group bacterium]|nr:hypothetical protein [Patescibacteria group bacterium]
MKLCYKIPLIIAVIISLMVVGGYCIASKIILASFSTVEKNQVLQELGRIEAALNSRVAAMQTFAGDYASWDATYDYVEHQSPAYILDTYESGSFYKLKLNVISVINNAGEVVYGKRYNWMEKVNQPLPEKFIETLKENNMLNFENPEDHKSGIVAFPDDLLLIVSNPILTSNLEGPIRGSLIMGRRVNSRLLKDLSESVDLDVSLAGSIDPSNLANIFKDSYISDDGLKVVDPIDNNNVDGYIALRDAIGTPVLVLKIELPRIGYNEGLNVLYLLIIALTIVGFITIFLTVFFLDYFIFYRLARLSH